MAYRATIGSFRLVRGSPGVRIVATVFAKDAGSRSVIVASTQAEIRRLARDGNAMQSEAASAISSGLSIVGKIIGQGALIIFGHVEGEVRASTIVIAEGAQIEGEVSAEELTIGGYVKGTIHANRVTLNSTAVVEGDIFHRTLVIEGSDASMKSARAIVRWNR
jgi:cytoskeletal protein CcmA (bactofilin family)